MKMTSSFKFACNSSPLSLSPDFILPDDESVRPYLSQVLSLTSIPTIDMNNNDHTSLISKISDACENYGFFQIINHGVSPDLYRQMMDMGTEFFRLPSEERVKLYSEDRHVSVRVGTHHIKFQNQEKVRTWNERLCHPAYPIDDINLLPENPPRYREVAAAYGKEIADLVYELFGFISEGLGLDKSYLQRRFGDDKSSCHLQVNFYPPCPEPELTIGFLGHTDMGLITILQQVEGVSGLQIMKDGKWLAVDPLPNALIVNVADQLEVLSNGKYKSVLHRAVTNKELPRISVVTFCRPIKDVVIGPIEELINEEHPPIYRNYLFEEFFEEFCRQEASTRRRVKQVFQSQVATLCDHPQ